MAYKRIVQIGSGRISYKTATAVAIAPGTLLERVTNEDTVQAQSVAEAAGTYPEAMIALENSLIGDETGDNIAASSQVPVYHAVKGDEISILLEDGENASFGDFLTANGTNGTLKVRDTATNPPFARALEAKDLSDSSNTTDALIRCVIL